MGENAQPFFTSSFAAHQALDPNPTVLLGMGAVLPAGISLDSTPGVSFAHRLKTFSSITISIMDVIFGLLSSLVLCLILQ